MKNKTKCKENKLDRPRPLALSLYPSSSSNLIINYAQNNHFLSNNYNNIHKTKTTTKKKKKTYALHYLALCMHLLRPQL